MSSIIKKEITNNNIPNKLFSFKTTLTQLKTQYKNTKTYKTEFHPFLKEETIYWTIAAILLL